MTLPANRTTLERAFDLANSGEYQTVTQLRRRLKAEGRPDVHAQLFGRSIVAQLRQICAASTAALSVDTP